MKALNIKPQPKIAEFVDKILVIENSGFLNPFILPLYANGVPTLLFTTVKGKLGHNKSQHLTLFGQTILPESLTLIEDFTMIAYFLKPYSLVSLFNIQANELTDKPIDITLLSPRKTNTLQDKLLNCKTIDNMISSIDDYVVEFIKSSKSVSDSIIYLTDKFSIHFSKESLANTQKELKTTERTLQRIFKHNIGVSPNTFRRICQFNAAFNDLNLGRFSNLSDIAYNNAYADQSHYIRTFKEFTRLTPSEYLKYGTT